MKGLSSPPDVFKDNKPHPLHSVLTLARCTRTRSKPRHLKADTALTRMSVLSHANYPRATPPPCPPPQIKVRSLLISKEKSGFSRRCRRPRSHAHLLHRNTPTRRPDAGVGVAAGVRRGKVSKHVPKVTGGRFKVLFEEKKKSRMKENNCDCDQLKVEARFWV